MIQFYPKYVVVCVCFRAPACTATQLQRYWKCWTQSRTTVLSTSILVYVNTLPHLRAANKHSPDGQCRWCLGCASKNEKPTCSVSECFFSSQWLLLHTLVVNAMIEPGTFWPVVQRFYQLSYPARLSCHCQCTVSLRNDMMKKRCLQYLCIAQCYHYDPWPSVAIWTWRSTCLKFCSLPQPTAQPPSPRPCWTAWRCSLCLGTLLKKR
jgi:hypothetical protein